MAHSRVAILRGERERETVERALGLLEIEEKISKPVMIKVSYYKGKC